MLGPAVPRGPVLDMGCAVGRTTFELAESRGEMVLGIDMNFGMLRVAMEVMTRGRVRFPLRRVGVVYDRKAFPATFAGMENVDFWVCDAAQPPFSEGAFSLAVSINVLDCLNAPYAHLTELARLLAPGGGAVLASPYDWTTGATPMEAWLGGHSQRSEIAGRSDALLRSLLAGGDHPGAIPALSLVDEAELPWRLRLHDRSRMDYQVHMMALRKGGS